MTTTAQFEKNQSVYDAYLRLGDLVRGGRVAPGWILGGPSFWFAEGGPQDRQIWVVDPIANTRAPLCDVEQLRKALTVALGYEPAGHGFPFAALQFVTQTSIAFSVDGASWTLDLESYALSRQAEVVSFDMLEMLPSEATRVTPKTFFQESFGAMGRTLVPEAVAPTGQWFASTQDGNVVLRSSMDGQVVALTSDATEQHFWHVETVRWRPWSPDGQRLVAFKSDTTDMVRVPTIHWLKHPPQSDEVISIPAGGVLNRDEVYILDVHGGAPVHVDLGDTTDQYLVVLGWRPDNSEL